MGNPLDVGDRTAEAGLNLPDVRHTRKWLAVGLIVFTSFYRSITFWTLNAWDLSSPAKVLVIGAVIAVVGIGVLSLLVKAGYASVPAALAVSAVIALFMYWEHVGPGIGLALVCLILALSWLGQRVTNSTFVVSAAIALTAAVGLGPMVQLLVAHVEDAQPYPLVELPLRAEAQASGSIEDVLVVIVDTYPNLALRQNWLGQSSEVLVESLRSNGFTISNSAWARHTYTALSVPSILELQSVVTAGPKGLWGNRSSAYGILRGDNLVSRTLQSAGFRYTHIESGWDGSSCGPNVDVCIESPWIDERVWQLMAPSILRHWLEDRYHTVTGTFNSVSALEKELSELSGNQTHDYVFAHLLLPHDPYLVDERCQPQEKMDDAADNAATRRAAFSAQMQCVDRLLATAMESVDENAAVLLTGDHGSDTGHQVGRDPQEWSDADIAERFGVFLAYKLPADCPYAQLSDPILTMNAILSCAVGERFVTPPPEYLIGAEDPEVVDPQRMSRIQAEVAAGLLPPDEG